MLRYKAHIIKYCTAFLLFTTAKSWETNSLIVSNFKVWGPVVQRKGVDITGLLGEIKEDWGLGTEVRERGPGGAPVRGLGTSSSRSWSFLSETTHNVNQVVARHGLRLHQYADDCQVCVTTSIDDVALAVDRLARCVSDVGEWMSSSRLRLNSSKTRAIWLGHKNQIDRVNINSVSVLSSSVSIVDSVRDLGVVIDSSLTMSDHDTALCRSAAGYYQLRQLRPLVRALPTLVWDTVVSRLRDRNNGTVYPQHCNNLTSNSGVSDDF